MVQKTSHSRIQKRESVFSTLTPALPQRPVTDRQYHHISIFKQIKRDKCQGWAGGSHRSIKNGTWVREELWERAMSQEEAWDGGLPRNHTFRPGPRSSMSSWCHVVSHPLPALHTILWVCFNLSLVFCQCSTQNPSQFSRRGPPRGSLALSMLDVLSVHPS